MKKILFTINTMGRAGAETALIELMKALEKLGGYELYLYVILPYGELFDKVPSSVKILNKNTCNKPLSTFYVKCRIILQILSSFLYKGTGFRMLSYMKDDIKTQKSSSGKVQYDKVLWRLLSLGRRKLEEEFDLGIAFIEGAATYYLVDMVKTRKKVSFVHIDYEKAGYTFVSDKQCYRNMDRIYVVSKEVGRKFLNVYPMYEEKVQLFRNILDVETIREKANLGHGFQDVFDGIRLVTVGRLHYQKGYDVAIRVLARIMEEGYNVRWYVIGEGFERKKLEQDIKRYGLEEDFILLGGMDNPYPYMKKADIYVQPSRFEGKSIAIEEAQILGKCIVASNCTGNTEQIIDEYDGILCNLEVETFANEIIALLKSKKTRQKLEQKVLEKKLLFPEDLEGLLHLIEMD